MNLRAVSAAVNARLQINLIKHSLPQERPLLQHVHTSPQLLGSDPCALGLCVQGAKVLLVADVRSHFTLFQVIMEAGKGLHPCSGPCCLSPHSPAPGFDSLLARHTLTHSVATSLFWHCLHLSASEELLIWQTHYAAI